MKKIIIMMTFMLMISLLGCGSTEDEAQTEDKAKTEAQTEAQTEDEAQTEAQIEDETEAIAEAIKASNDDIRPEFKEAMDSYELFFDEYIEFMKKYQDSEDTVSMLADYTTYMTKYTETMEKMDAINEDDLTAAELAYYAEVTARISQKLSESIE